jgi:hypothetical protein
LNVVNIWMVLRCLVQLGVTPQQFILQNGSTYFCYSSLIVLQIV